MFPNPFHLLPYYCRVVASYRLSKQLMLSDAGGKQCNAVALAVALAEDRGVPGNKFAAWWMNANRITSQYRLKLGSCLKDARGRRLKCSTTISGRLLWKVARLLTAIDFLLTLSSANKATVTFNPAHGSQVWTVSGEPWNWSSDFPVFHLGKGPDCLKQALPAWISAGNTHHKRLRDRCQAVPVLACGPPQGPLWWGRSSRRHLGSLVGRRASPEG